MPLPYPAQRQPYRTDARIGHRRGYPAIAQRFPVPCFSQYPDNAVIRNDLFVQLVQKTFDPGFRPVP